MIEWNPIHEPPDVPCDVLGFGVNRKIQDLNPDLFVITWDGEYFWHDGFLCPHHSKPTHWAYINFPY